jgi:hypothetical protein
MLKTVLETMDGIDDAFKSLYTETDGKFVLQIEGVDHHPDVANLKSAYERVKQDKAAVMAERDTFKAKAEKMPEDFDLSAWEKAKSGKADEAALIKMRAELEADRDSWKNKAGEAEGKLSRFAVERDLGDALLAAGITDPGLSQGARAILASQVKTGDDGKAIVESDMGPLGVGDYVKRWAAGDGKAFVTPPSGGGRKGGDGSGQTSDNPWKAETRNLTKQAEIMKSNPEEAARLKAAAGIT